MRFEGAAAPRSGCDGFFGQQRPGDTGIFRRDRDAGSVVAASLLYGTRPARKRIIQAIGALQDRARAHDKQHAQVRVATFRDVPESALAAGGVLPGHQTEPGTELPPVFKVMAVANRRGVCRGGDRPNTRSGMRTARERIGSHVGFDPPLSYSRAFASS